MKRFVALLLALCMLPCAALAAQDYTVAEKLLRQLWAGSGFSGVLSVTFNTETMATIDPITMDVDYIYVRPTDEETDEHRIDLTLTDGEKALSAACIQYKDDVLSFQADVVSPDWYSYESRRTATPSAVQAAMEEGAASLMAQSLTPALLQTLSSFALALPGVDGLEDTLEPYQTRIDVWIEGYRQDAVLGKLDDGTTTMEVSYIVPPIAIKSQMKQMVVDMLSDSTLRSLLGEALSENEVKLFLNPRLQSWYFEVIDQIPLDGDLSIDRMVSLKGDTLHLRVALPLYDATTGVAAIVYERTGGAEDLPDSQTLSLESGDALYELVYQTYSSMTGVQVVQGTLKLAKPEKEQSLAFTLRQSETTALADDGREVYGYDLTLDLSPAENMDFSPVQIALVSRFMSRELKSAATEIDATLTLEDETTGIQLDFNGTSRKKWEPAELPPYRVSIHDLTQQDIASILPGAAVRLAALFAPMIQTIP